MMCICTNIWYTSHAGAHLYMHMHMDIYYIHLYSKVPQGILVEDLHRNASERLLNESFLFVIELFGVFDFARNVQISVCCSVASFRHSFAFNFDYFAVIGDRRFLNLHFLLIQMIEFKLKSN